MSLLLLVWVAGAQMQDAPATLVPPTPVPVSDAGVEDVLRSESIVAKIQRDGVIRVGVLYNEPSFGEFNIRGEVSGFDAALARLLAETWGIEAQLVQVTRQNALAMLQGGQVDLLAAALVHRRELDKDVEFSASYRVSRQAMMVRAEGGIESLFNLSNQPVGYVQGTASEIALQEYMARTGLPLQAVPYLTLDQAMTGLFNNEVQGVVGREEHLLRVAASFLDQIRLLDDPVSIEPFALALPRQDIHFRNLVNRTLHYLIAEDKLRPLYETYFPGKDIPLDAIVPWANVGDEAPVPSQFGGDVPFPPQYIVPRLMVEKILRVGGVPEVIPDTAPEREKRLATFHKALLERMASRWGVTVQYVPGDPMQLLQAGMVDVAVGVPLDWAYAGQVDFTQPYLLHGDRLLTKANSDINGFNELRGRWIAVINTDEGARERAQAWADSITASVRFYETSQDEAVAALLTQNNADVIYGDSLKLIGYLEQNPTELELAANPSRPDGWYSRSYMAFAVPRNDMDFRLLMNYTLQDLTLSGELKTLLTPLMPPNSEPPAFDVWPGTNALGGILSS